MHFFPIKNVFGQICFRKNMVLKNYVSLKSVSVEIYFRPNMVYKKYSSGKIQIRQNKFPNYANHENIFPTKYVFCSITTFKYVSIKKICFL